VVTKTDGRIAPGELFFKLHGKERARDLNWWRDELQRTASYDWERVLE
jgi:hypothetical protein